MTYKQQLTRNLKLGYIQAFTSALYFTSAIWYTFEIQFATQAQINLIYLVIQILTILMELPTGALADIFGRKTTIILGYTLQGISWIIITMQSLPALWIGYMVNTIGIALISGSDTALIYDTLKELKQEKEFSKYTSKLSLIFKVAIILATFTGGILYTKVDPKLPYLLLATAHLTTAILYTLFTEPQIDSEHFNIKNYIQQIRQGLQETTRNTQTKLFSIYYAVVGGILWYNTYFLSMAFLSDAGLPEHQTTLLTTSMYIISAIAIYIIVHRSKYLAKDKVLPIFTIFVTLAFLPGIIATPITASIIFILTRGAGSARYVILDYYANKNFRSKFRATALSALNMGTSFIYAVIAILFTNLLKTSNALTVTTYLGIISAIILIPLTRFIIRKQNLLLKTSKEL